MAKKKQKTPVDSQSLAAKVRSAAKQKAFLEAYRKCGHLRLSAEEAGIYRTLHNYWLATDPNYKPKFDEAHEDACEALETEARRRAVDGVEEPVFYKGAECGKVRKYSDTLLIFLMKGAMPTKYRERLEITPSTKELDDAIRAGMAELATRRQTAVADLHPGSTAPAAGSNGHNGNGHGHPEALLPP